MLLSWQNDPIRGRDSVPCSNDLYPSVFEERLEGSPNRIATEPCPLHEERLAHCTVVAVKTIRETKKSAVENLCSRRKGWQKLVCYFVVKAEEERFIEMIPECEICAC